MDKGMKMKVGECCDRKFFVNPNENWKTLCKKCFIDYYLPVRSKFKQSELKGHWKSVRLYVNLKYKVDQILEAKEREENLYGLQPYWTGSEYDYR
jgi:hypothetical protein